MLWRFAAESSIHAPRIFKTLVLNRVVHVETSKNEVTWCALLEH